MVLLQEDGLEPDGVGDVLLVVEGQRFELLRVLEEDHHLLEPVFVDEHGEVDEAFGFVAEQGLVLDRGADGRLVDGSELFRGSLEVFDVLISVVLGLGHVSDAGLVVVRVVLLVGHLVGAVRVDVEELLVGAAVEEVRVFVGVEALFAERYIPLIIFEELAVDVGLENDAGTEIVGTDLAPGDGIAVLEESVPEAGGDGLDVGLYGLAKGEKEEDVGRGVQIKALDEEL